MGVDGMRLDAVPYLIEREGTSCENLYETHLVLKELRSSMDTQLQRPHAARGSEPVAGRRRARISGGDECHMAFNFPLMPRIFMALRAGRSASDPDIVSQTPEIPDSASGRSF